MRVESPEPKVEGRRRAPQAVLSTLVLRLSTAFTLVELLTVLAIMAIIAGLAVSALKNFGESDAMSAADQQMLGDIARARQLAMSQRTTVYMVFVPMDFWNFPCTCNGNNYSTLLAGVSSITPASAQQPILIALTNLSGQQFTGYTFMANGAMGDQPGQHRWHYLTPWQTLPQGTFILTNKFNLPGTVVSSANPGSALFGLWNQTYPHFDQNTIYTFGINAFPVPSEESPVFIYMPFIAFNYLGQLTTNGVEMAAAHEYIPLARASWRRRLTPTPRRTSWPIRPADCRRSRNGRSTATAATPTTSLT